jgi:hypothetical protein
VEVGDTRGGAEGGGFCRQCGAALTPANQFCPACGKPAHKRTPPPPSAEPVASAPGPAPVAAATGGGGRSRKLLIGLAVAAVVLAGAIAVGIVIASSSGGSKKAVTTPPATVTQPTTEPPATSTPKTTPTPAATYGSEIAKPLAQLARAASRIGVAMGTAATPADLIAVRQAARAEIPVVVEARDSLARLVPNTAARERQQLLLKAANAQQLFLTNLARSSSLSSPTAALGALDVANRFAAKASISYHLFFKQERDTQDVITTAGQFDTSPVRAVLNDRKASLLAAARTAAQKQAAAQKAAAAAAAAAARAKKARSNLTAGVPTDIVAFSGGEGVRYRYSTTMADVVPGNGPLEGVPVSIYCYAVGQIVRGNDLWAKVATSPEMWVPATYLKLGNSGTFVSGATWC